MKTKIKWILHNFVLFVLSFLMASAALICLSIVIIRFVNNPVNYEPTVGINIARAEEEKEMPMKLWVLNEVYKAGLNPNEAECIIQKESGWKDDAIGATKDYGLWQINIQHKKTISLRDMFDYKEATEWSIAKRLHDGNWNAWYGWAKCK
jgi:hypothetical protein